MSDTDNVWYRLGYAFESTRHGAAAEPLRGLAERGLSRARHRRAEAAADRDSRHRPANPATNGRPTSTEEALEALLAAGAGTLVGRILGIWTPRRQPGVLGLARGALAGAGAAFLRKLLRPLLHGEVRAPVLDEALVDALLAGAARGLLYASIVEPRLAGPALVRGAVYGTAEYAVSPWGGLAGIVGKHAPHRRFPLLAGLFEEYADEEDTLVDHLAFAVALAVLYGDEGGPPGEESAADD